jgi:hypothetical protein
MRYTSAIVALPLVFFCSGVVRSQEKQPPADAVNEADKAVRERELALKLLTADQKFALDELTRILDTGRSSAEAFGTFTIGPETTDRLVYGPLKPFLYARFLKLAKENPGPGTAMLDDALELTDDSRLRFAISPISPSKNLLPGLAASLKRAITTKASFIPGYDLDAIKKQPILRDMLLVYLKPETQAEIAKNVAAAKAKEEAAAAEAERLARRAALLAELASQIQRDEDEIKRLEKLLDRTKKSGTTSEMARKNLANITKKLEATKEDLKACLEKRERLASEPPESKAVDSKGV